MMNGFAPVTALLSFGERASTAGIVTLEGMAAIFLVLALLWGIVEILHRVIHRGEKTAPAASPAPAAQDVAAPAAEPAEDSGALIAAITAAISAALAEEGYDGAFRVVSFKRVSSGNRKNRR